MKNILLILFSTLVLSCFTLQGQSKVMTFEEAKKQGKSDELLDSIYKSAIHADVTLAVFKTTEEQATLQKAYSGFIQQLGTFLKENNFTWGKSVRCFNRIYLSGDGSVDYFLYNFPKDEITNDKEKEFVLLLNRFIVDHKFGLTAAEKFAQCSPIRYSD